ncbi:MAG: AAA family ATPase [Pseudomonadota bacterium]
MIRSLESNLFDWFKKAKRKPMVIRGARQVGKSTLVRNFAKSQNLDLLEINLERNIDLDSMFEGKKTDLILKELEAICKKTIGPNSLLFLDEIQATPFALPCLRYFYEDYPNLPIITAGSLLEFTLANHNYSMPVGRIEYLHLNVMSFKEFLQALDEDYLLSVIDNFSFDQSVPSKAHKLLLNKQREYLFTGGMPEAVLIYKETKSFAKCREVHRSIIETYQDDFPKYSKYSQASLVHKIFNSIPQLIGKKVKYSHITKDEPSYKLKLIIDLFIKARLLLPAYHSDCSGIPLKTQANDKIYKLYFLDIGLLNYMLGLDWRAISNIDERKLVNEGMLAEQFIAQHLAYNKLGLEQPELYYWIREGKSLNAEVDFVISCNQNTIPIEVKAGKSGTLKSLQQFILSKKASKAIRFDLNPPSSQEVSHQLRQKEKLEAAKFKLISLPCYLIEELEKCSVPL